MPARAWFSVAANRAQPCTIVAAKQHGGHFEHKLGVRKLSYVQLAVGRKAKLRIRVAQIRLAHAICLYDMEPPRTFFQTPRTGKRHIRGDIQRILFGGVVTVISTSLLSS